MDNIIAPGFAINARKEKGGREGGEGKFPTWGNTNGAGHSNGTGVEQKIASKNLISKCTKRCFLLANLWWQLMSFSASVEVCRKLEVPDLSMCSLQEMKKKTTLDRLRKH